MNGPGTGTDLSRSYCVARPCLASHFAEPFVRRTYSSVRRSPHVCFEGMRPMPERLMTSLRNSRPTLLPVAQKPRLVCFSHLRWDFVWQPPQHLLTRAAKNYDVLVIEEPFSGLAETSAHRTRPPCAGGITIAVPVLPEGLSEDIIAEQHDLIEKLIGRETTVAAGFLVLRADGARLRAISNAISASMTTWTNSLSSAAHRGSDDRAGERSVFARGGYRLYGRHEPLRGQA